MTPRSLLQRAGMTSNPATQPLRAGSPGEAETGGGVVQGVCGVELGQGMCHTSPECEGARHVLHAEETLPGGLLKPRSRAGKP